MKKRLLSTFLSLAMLISTVTALPQTAGAADALPNWTVDFEELSVGQTSASLVDMAKKGFDALQLLFKNSYEPTSGYEIAAGGLTGKDAADKYMKITGEKTTGSLSANLIGTIGAADRDIAGRSLHISFDIAVSDNNTSRVVYVADSTAGAAQLTLLQNRGDGIGIGGTVFKMPTDDGLMEPDTWYNFSYEIIPTGADNVTIVKAWVDGEPIGYAASTTHLTQGIFERIGVIQSNWHDAFTEGDYTCIDNLSVEVREPAEATSMTKYDYTVDFQELSEGPTSNAALQDAKDGWREIRYRQNDVQSDENIAITGGVYGKAGDDMALQLNSQPEKVTGGTYLEFYPVTGADKLSPGDVINVSFDMAIDATDPQLRIVHFRGNHNDEDRVELFRARGDGIALAGTTYRGIPTSTGIEAETWYSFDFEIRPGDEATGRKTVIKSWFNGQFMGRTEHEVLDRGIFQYLYLEIAEGHAAFVPGCVTYLDNIRYQVLSGDSIVNIQNENTDIYVADTSAYAAASARVSSLGAWTGTGYQNIEVLKDGAQASPDDLLMDCELKVTRMNGTTFTLPFGDINDTRTAIYSNTGENAPISMQNVDRLYANFGAQTTSTTETGVAGRSADDSSIKISTKTAEGETLDNAYAPWFNIGTDQLGYSFDQYLPETLTLALSVLVDDPNNDGRFRFQLGYGSFGDEINVYHDRVQVVDTGRTISYTPGEWVRLEMVINPTKIIEFYVNGEYAGQYQDTLAGYNRFRFDYYIGAKGNVDSAFYVDDIYIGYGRPKSYTPAADMVKGSTDPSVVDAVIADKELYTNGTATVGEVMAYLDMDESVTAVRAYTDRTMTAEAADGAVMETGNVVVFTNGTDYLYYDVFAPGTGYERTAFRVYSNGQAASGTFAAGNVSAEAEYTTYTADIPEQIIIAQYSADNRLIGAAVSTGAQLTGAVDQYKASEAVVEATLAVTGEAGTTVKVMLWDEDTMQPLLAEAVVLTPANTETITSVSTRFPGFTDKATTFSFDDGVDNANTKNDADLIAVFNEYGVSGTFNLISDQNACKNLDAGVLRARYAGHEIANHIKGHPHIDSNFAVGPESVYVATAAEFIQAIEDGKSELEAVFGTGTVNGLAWAYNDPTVYAESYSGVDKEVAQEISDYVMTSDTIQYARRTGTTGTFAIPENFMAWETTGHFNTIPGLADTFFNAAGDDLKLYSIWGHAYELDDSSLAYIADYIERAIDNNVWIAPNIDVVNYVNATKALSWTAEKVTNDSDMDLYVMINGVVPAVVKANSEYYLYGNATPTLYLAGDSTCEDYTKPGNPQSSLEDIVGWGMVFEDNVSIPVDNRAIMNKSTKTFASDWDALIADAKQGDYVFIQFGHNDSMTDDRGVTVDEYRTNLTAFVQDAQEKDVTPVFLTSTRANNYGSDGKIADDAVDPYRNAMISLGESLGVTVLDVGAEHRAFLDTLTPEEAAAYYCVGDTVHFNQAGAEKLAEIVCDLIEKSDLYELKFYV